MSQLETLQDLNTEMVQDILATEDKELLYSMKDVAHAYFLTGRLKMTIPLLQLLFGRM